MDSIYLDHNATTPMRPEVARAMAQCCADGFANPASRHRPGQRSRKILEDARERIAQILGANTTGRRPDRLIFTSGTTEANNLALLGTARAGGRTPGRIVISAVEHQSVIEPAEALMEQGWDHVGLPVGPDGIVRADLLPGLLNDATRVVSVTLANHDTGVLQPVSALAETCNRAGVPLHTDAAQVVGKLPVDFRALGVAAMSLGAHKFGGPVGIGALLMRHDFRPLPLMHGGAQQEGFRPGTESVALAVGMLAALEVWQREQEAQARRMRTLRDRFESRLKKGAPAILVHGAAVARLPNTSNIALPGLDGQILMMALDLAGIACSTGSACSSGSPELSLALRAMGLPEEIVKASLRFSLGPTTTEPEIDEAVARILRVIVEVGR